MTPIDGPAPERDVFALLPPVAKHLLAEITLTALGEAAAELAAR